MDRWMDGGLGRVGWMKGWGDWRRRGRGGREGESGGRERETQKTGEKKEKDKPIDLIIFKQRNSSIAVIRQERSRGPIGRVDALEVAACVEGRLGYWGRSGGINYDDDAGVAEKKGDGDGSEEGDERRGGSHMPGIACIYIYIYILYTPRT